ncbi:tetratricopeptide repeat protein [Methylomonas sp. UP202]|uniref:tetratricopeptide repeat protein n=1 Tax=Methylomonas sp. UP202 TaxID=3040943 RepID=UPI00143BCECF|nr:tetratricopeptide repeat protein [Methylomonas sp. UP202]NJA07338.1 tetratricopeptide repeat protein [Methylococcaceae bacterium WWC4]WGS87275.1 tetratricopeptide repeat protein [Methylomonas sp. UP202]
MTDIDPDFPPPEPTSLRLMLLLLLLGLTAGLALAWTFLQPASAPEPPTRIIQPILPPPAPTSTLDIATEADKLLAGRDIVPTLADQAAQARQALLAGDFATAGRALEVQLTQSRIQDWGFAPFDRFVKLMVVPGNTALLQRLDQWLAQDQPPALAYLLRAQYHYDTGWRIRGHDYAAKVSMRHRGGFEVENSLAATDIAQAIVRDDANPYSRYLLLAILQGYGNSLAMDGAFRLAIRRFPDYYPLYRVQLNTLTPKWGGSVAEMLAFTQEYVDSAAAISPLKLLYLNLYEDLLDIAGAECFALAPEKRADCIDQALRNVAAGRDLQADIRQALALYTPQNSLTFGAALEPILAGIARTEGNERQANNLLQLTAESMGHNIELAATDTSRNHFMLDQQIGAVWYRAGHYANAETLYRRALADLDRTAFPNATQKNAATAAIYDRLAGIYNANKQYEQVLVYQSAAEKLAGIYRKDWSHLQCTALVKLKRYQEAVRACGAQIDRGNDWQALSRRGEAYEALGQTDAALADYAEVANSEHDGRAYAAIQISVLYAKRNDMPNMLATLNRYDFLYDADQVSRQDVAIAYNNRCYAKMQLGQNEAALKDCDASLEYGNLPDARAKQQDLQKRLSAGRV